MTEQPETIAAVIEELERGGELIAARLTQEPLPMDIGLAAALDPNRFLLRRRGLKRLIGAGFD